MLDVSAQGPAPRVPNHAFEKVLLTTETPNCFAEYDIVFFIEKIRIFCAWSSILRDRDSGGHTDKNGVNAHCVLGCSSQGGTSVRGHRPTTTTHPSMERKNLPITSNFTDALCFTFS